MRGKAEDANHRDENRAGGAEAAESGGDTPAAGAGEEEEENEKEVIFIRTGSWVTSFTQDPKNKNYHRISNPQ